MCVCALSVYMHPCVYACVYVRMCMRMYACVHACVYVRMCMRMYACVCTLANVPFNVL